MVTVETKIQQAIKEILEEETWKHLKSNNNFDKVLSIASLPLRIHAGEAQASTELMMNDKDHYGR